MTEDVKIEKSEPAEKGSASPKNALKEARAEKVAGLKKKLVAAGWDESAIPSTWSPERMALEVSEAKRKAAYREARDSVKKAIIDRVEKGPKKA